MHSSKNITLFQQLSNDAGGGLLVYNPVAPTPQLIQMMRRLEKDHGPVRHIILGTVALEHKVRIESFFLKLLISLILPMMIQFYSGHIRTLCSKFS